MNGTPVMREIGEIMLCELPTACGPGRMAMVDRFGTPQDAYETSEWLALWWMRTFLPPDWFERAKEMLCEVDRIFLDLERLGFPSVPVVQRMFRTRLRLAMFKWVDDVARNRDGPHAEAAMKLLSKIPEAKWRERSGH